MGNYLAICYSMKTILGDKYPFICHPFGYLPGRGVETALVNVCNSLKLHRNGNILSAMKKEIICICNRHTRCGWNQHKWKIVSGRQTKEVSTAHSKQNSYE